MTVTPQRPFMSIEEYLTWEPQQEVRYEYVQGELYGMTGGTIPHNDIAINLLSILLPHVRDQGCRLNMADVKLRIAPRSLYYYPDLIISCDPRDLQAHQYIQYPKLIAEVLSPKTATKDRGSKFKDYRTISSLQEYLLIDSESMSVECYRRGEGRLWLYYPYGPGDAIDLDSIPCCFGIAELYTGITFEPQP